MAVAAFFILLVILIAVGALVPANHDIKFLR
jgi:hypothetical protein